MVSAVVIRFLHKLVEVDIIDMKGFSVFSLIRPSYFWVVDPTLYLPSSSDIACMTETLKILM